MRNLIRKWLGIQSTADMAQYVTREEITRSYGEFNIKNVVEDEIQCQMDSKIDEAITTRISEGTFTDYVVRSLNDKQLRP